MIKEKKTKVSARKSTRIFVSVRLPAELKVQFDELCRRKGLHVNQAYVRLVALAITKESLPEHIENPRLTGWMPNKEEPPITPTLL